MPKPKTLYLRVLLPYSFIILSYENIECYDAACNTFNFLFKRGGVINVVISTTMIITANISLLRAPIDLPILANIRPTSPLGTIPIPTVILDGTADMSFYGALFNVKDHIISDRTLPRHVYRQVKDYVYPTSSQLTDFKLNKRGMAIANTCIRIMNKIKNRERNLLAIIGTKKTTTEHSSLFVEDIDHSLRIWIRYHQ